MNPTFANIIQYREDAIIEMSKNILEEAISAHFMAPEVGSLRRREIALSVEKMLWREPFLSDENYAETLEEFSAYFKVTTRTIQIAIQEQFGLGFVAFRRLVKLTQLRKAILASGGDRSLTAMATDYRLHLGRLSKEYQDIFGLKPSVELKRIRQQKYMSAP